MINNRIYNLNDKRYLSKIFFYAGIICELVVSFSGYLIGGYHENIVIIAGMLLFCISILLDFDLKRDILICVVCAGYGLVSYYFQHSAFILRIALAIIAGKRQESKAVFKLFFWGTLAGMLYFGLLSILGVHNSVYIERVFRSTVEKRYSFGFYHPNGYALFLFRVVVMGFFTYIDKIKPMLLGICSIMAIVLIYPAKSKSGLVMLLFSIILFGIYKFINKKFAAILSVCSSIGVLLLWLYIRFQDSIPQNEKTFKLWMFVDKLTTGRSGDSYYAMQKNRVTLFGEGFGPETSEMGIVDSIYCQGLVFVVILLIVTIYLYYYSFKNRKYDISIVIGATVLYSISETFLEYFNKNMIWMLCVGVLGGIPTIKNAISKAD